MVLSLLRSLLILLAMLAGVHAGAVETTVEGVWKTIDDESGQVRALVRISETDGEYLGRIEKTFPQPGEDPNPRCDACDGARHNQPLAGMIIIEHIKKQGDEFSGGTILDPETGTTYRCRMTLAKHGRKLLVRGFVGFSLFGRTQTWLLAE